MMETAAPNGIFPGQGPRLPPYPSIATTSQSFVPNTANPTDPVRSYHPAAGHQPSMWTYPHDSTRPPTYHSPLFNGNQVQKTSVGYPSFHPHSHPPSAAELISGHQHMMASLQPFPNRLYPGSEFYHPNVSSTCHPPHTQHPGPMHNGSFFSEFPGFPPVHSRLGPEDMLAESTATNGGENRIGFEDPL